MVSTLCSLLDHFLRDLSDLRAIPAVLAVLAYPAYPAYPAIHAIPANPIKFLKVAWNMVTDSHHRHRDHLFPQCFGLDR
jgi:hypothetical protein